MKNMTALKDGQTCQEKINSSTDKSILLLSISTEIINFHQLQSNFNKKDKYSIYIYEWLCRIVNKKNSEEVKRRHQYDNK